MLHTLFVFVAVKGGCILMGVFLDFSRETARNLIRRDPLLESPINFHSVAGRKQQRFRTTRIAQNAFAPRRDRQSARAFPRSPYDDLSDAEKSHRME
jgi:hypothetical protein